MLRWSAKRCLNYIYDHFNLDESTQVDINTNLKNNINDNDDDVYDENSNIMSINTKVNYKF